MNRKVKSILLVVIVPTLYALVLRLLFGVDGWDDLFEVMSITFLFLLPTILGALTVYLSPLEKVRSLSYRMIIPWVPLLLFLILTIAIAIEGWACWLMILPVFMFTSSMGGLIGGHYKLKGKNEKINISLLVFLPFLVAPIESNLGRRTAVFEVPTYIDIKADRDAIWDNVTRVTELKESDDTGWLTEFLGFPRPVSAELNYEGVGAYRKAIFTNGLVFHETVTEYKDNELMKFTIDANPQEIPSTTLDEHVLIGGKYFDVLSGKYELEKLDDESFRLHLSSRFKMTTTFNFYAGWWGKLIMKDIQENILRVEKIRAQNISRIDKSSE
ncbi:hypothetical protein GGR28_003747 [Lewinella aquimaris]|uniref:SRPBCC family protein n=1 Tax=Neolewinella aquimaris TaxID=1835722 RepID=A0A840E7U3_9BACT|nr:hypothetical protein [Neolewinella aquimaris]MBB4081100.1 hypothetical protein [Neolewinella aquimaris]